MRALVTGGSGFLGRALVSGLAEQGYDTDVLGRSDASEITCDLAAGVPDLAGRRYDVIVHAAGKAHVVPRTDQEADDFFRVNVGGTQNLIRALDPLPGAFVLISSASVYGREEGEAIAESEPLGALEPYGASKVAAEAIVAEWGQAQGVRVSMLRLPLVAGPCPPGNLGALIRAIERNRYVHIGGGSTRRSVVLAEDVARALPALARVGGIYNLTDGHHPSFAEIEAALSATLDKRRSPSLPVGLARLGGWAGDAIERVTGHSFPLTSRTVRKMTSSLTLSDERARHAFGWSPRPVLSEVREWASGCESM